MTALPSLSTALPPFSAALQSHMPFWQQWMTCCALFRPANRLSALVITRGASVYAGLYQNRRN